MKYKIIKTKELADSEVEIECEIESEIVITYHQKTITKIQKEITLPGFRPGHVPETILVKQVGDLAIYNEMADMAINDSFADIITEAKVNFISMPNVQITKLAIGNPLQFKIIGPIMPEIKLPNYKKIAEKVNGEKEESPEATEKELEETVEEIRKNYHARQNVRVDTSEKQTPPEDSPLPEIDEEWVKKLGAFSTVEDFKNKIKDGIKQEKEFKNKDKKRLSIIEKILEETKVVIPKIMIESELKKMQAQFEDDINRAGLKTEDYLKHLKKSPEDLKKEWTPDAEKRAKVQLIITKIALAEKIEADPEQVKKEIEHLLKTYKDATEDRTRAYVEMMLTNEKVFAWLESQK
jgi:FKBP-type peptidyl-prolyl cis-trans isomerase (trigger factor)